MAILGGWVFLMSEVPLHPPPFRAFWAFKRNGPCCTIETRNDQDKKRKSVSVVPEWVFPGSSVGQILLFPHGEVTDRGDVSVQGHLAHKKPPPPRSLQ